MFGDILEGIEDELPEDAPKSMLISTRAPVSQPPSQQPTPRPSTPGGGAVQKLGVQTGLVMTNADKLPAKKAPQSKPTLVLHESSDENEDVEGGGEGGGGASSESGREASASGTASGSALQSPSQSATVKTVIITKPELDSKMGITAVTVMEDGAAKGARISSVSEGGLAALAGLKAGDVICKINDSEVSTHEQFTDMVKTCKGEVKLQIVEKSQPTQAPSKDKKSMLGGMLGGFTKKDKKEASDSAAATPRPPATPRSTEERTKKDVVVTKVTEETALGLEAVTKAEGVEIKGVEADGLAAKAGLVAGDVIKRLNGLAVSKADMFTELLKSAVGEIKLEVHSMPTPTPKAASDGAPESSRPAVDTTIEASPERALSPSIIPYPHPATAPVAIGRAL